MKNIDFFFCDSYIHNGMRDNFYFEGMRDKLFNDCSVNYVQKLYLIVLKIIIQ